MTITRHITISGRVQGVGYREALREQAQATGVTGWVRNRRDGTVEAMLQGDEAPVVRLIVWARCGPPAARVSDVQARPASGEYDRTYIGFERLPTD
jgi:acylphosphatase